jgi:AraC-like DNA-binding protein
LLRAIFDPQIGEALKSMHEKVDARWTVETLATACGMSHSAFALPFKEMVGEWRRPPRYCRRPSAIYRSSSGHPVESRASLNISPFISSNLREIQVENRRRRHSLRRAAMPADDF